MTVKGLLDLVKSIRKLPHAKTCAVLDKEEFNPTCSCGKDKLIEGMKEYIIEYNFVDLEDEEAKEAKDEH